MVYASHCVVVRQRSPEMSVIQHKISARSILCASMMEGATSVCHCVIVERVSAQVGKSASLSILILSGYVKKLAQVQGRERGRLVLRSPSVRPACFVWGSLATECVHLHVIPTLPFVAQARSVTYSSTTRPKWLKLFVDHEKIVMG